MGEGLVVAEGLRRVFGSGEGVRGVDLEVARGQVHALVGLNGAGKTTLLRLLLGMLRPHGGVARIGGREVAGAAADVWASVGHLVGGPLVYADLDARTNVAAAARLHRVPVRAVDVAVDGILHELALERYAAVRARVLSAGNRQRVGLATALVHDPTVIVLDEPTNGLDPAGIVLLRESLLRRASRGAGVLVSSHHLDEVARVADRISVINRGRVIGRLDPAGAEIERAFFALVHADDRQQAP